MAWRRLTVGLMVLGLVPAVDVDAQDGLPTSRPIPKPLLVIGDDGDPDAEFVRIGTAFRTSSGAFAVVEVSGTDIRIFGPEGQFLRRLGRSGEGPGEFRRIAKLFASRDTLFVYDGVLRRLTLYTVNGRLLKTLPFEYPPEEGSLAIIGRQRSGAWVVATAAHTPGWSNGPGVYRDTSRVGVLPGSLSGAVRWFGMVPGMTFFVHTPVGRQSEWRVGALPFSPGPIIASLQDSVLVGDLSSFHIRYHAPNGRVSRVLQLPRPPVPSGFSRAMSEDLARARTQPDSAYVRLGYAAAEKHPRQIWERLVVADDGTLWLGVSDPSPGAARRYLAVTPSGRVAGSWLLPPRSRLLSVKGSELLVVVKDTDDVERIIVIRI